MPSFLGLISNQAGEITADRLTVGPFGRISLPSFEMTPHGMKCKFPVAEVNGVTIAVLLCETGDQHIGLLLHRVDPEVAVHDVDAQVYNVGWAFKSGHTYRYTRTVELGRDLYHLRFRGTNFQAEWRDIIIHAVPGQTDKTDAAHLLLLFDLDSAPDDPVRIPRCLMNTLYHLKFLHSCSVGRHRERGNMEGWIDFHDPKLNEGLRIRIGMCFGNGSESAPSAGRAVHWAWAEPQKIENWRDNTWVHREHDCNQDHVDDWPNGSKAFGDDQRRISLSFAPCVHTPETTRVLYIGLSGSVYEERQQRLNVFLPPREALAPWRQSSTHNSSSVAQFAARLYGVPSFARGPLTLSGKREEDATPVFSADAVLGGLGLRGFLVWLYRHLLGSSFTQATPSSTIETVGES